MEIEMYFFYGLRSAEAVGKAPTHPQVHSAKGKTMYTGKLYSIHSKRKHV